MNRESKDRRRQLHTERAKREACRKMARTASLNSKFVVWSDAQGRLQQRRVTDSFGEALELLRHGEFGSMLIAFEWQLGNRCGRGKVKYFRISHPMATESYVRQTARNLVLQRVADGLYQRYHAAA